MNRKKTWYRHLAGPLLALAALAFVLAACDREELGTGASAPVLITASSGWITDAGTRAVKESFAAGDEITLSYDDDTYVYKLDKVLGWLPKTAADELRIPIDGTPDLTVSATHEDAEDNTLSASGTFYATATAKGEKAWGISLEFAYTEHGAIDLTLLDETLVPLTGITEVTITRGSVTTVAVATADDLKGIIVPAGAITTISATDGTDTYSTTLSAAAGTVVKGKRHVLTVVLTKQ